MSDTKSQPLSVELIANCINDLAREIGVMDPDDPGRATVLEELSLLTQLKYAAKFATDAVAGQCMDELAREVATLTPGDPRRAQIVQEIMRLSDTLHQMNVISD